MYYLEHDIFLFYNDLAEYKNSKQGKAVEKALSGKNKKKIEKALTDYWIARNGNGLEYDCDQDKIDGRNFDNWIAELYRDQN